ncbi:MAG: nucleotide sugar dehydrogenase [Planctomycetota bacterium]
MSEPSTPAERLAVIGLGYVGLPVALAFAKAGFEVVGFDVDQTRIAELNEGRDRTGQSTAEQLASCRVRFTCDSEPLGDRSFFVITVPTPVDEYRAPDLTALRAACRTAGAALSPGAVVVIESTVFPGCTDEVCAPILEGVSGLRRGPDFTLGYSPERINPGDLKHTLESVVKVIAADDPDTLERLAAAYGAIAPAGLHRAPDIRTAEAAKVIENTQRDLNIALMNELAIIFDRLGISTRDVLAAAGTKWNFLPFTPGLVGGHCIGVDPYYLTHRAEATGYHPEVVLAGRRINDGMGRYVAQKMIRLLIAARRTVHQTRVGVLGLSFKENVADVRNTRVIDVVRELEGYGVSVFVHDPVVDPAAAEREHGVSLVGLDRFERLDGLILAVPHRAFVQAGVQDLTAGLAEDGVLIDVRSSLDRGTVPASLRYWSL